MERRDMQVLQEIEEVRCKGRRRVQTIWTRAFAYTPVIVSGGQLEV